MMSVESTVRATDTLDTPTVGVNNEFVLSNSVVVAEYGPVGLILRIERTQGRTDYAGPFDDPVATISVLSEVAE